MRESASILRMEAVLALDPDEGQSTESKGGTGLPVPDKQEAQELYLANMSKVLDDG